MPEFLSRDDFGGIDLAGHRVSLGQLLWHYNDGFSPEMLVSQFPTLSLAIVHRTIAFYLENRTEVNRYLAAATASIEAHRKSGPILNVAELRERLAAAKSTS